MNRHAFRSAPHGACGSVAIIVCFAALPARAGDWPQFRGPHSGSVADATDTPQPWSGEPVVAWKVDLPGRGPSSPIVVGNRVLITASSGNLQDRLHVLCYDAGTGKLNWERQFWATGRTITHPQSANAAPTPVSDGQAVFAFFSSNDLVALDLDGRLLWYRGLGFDYPRLGNDAGMASSPLVVDGTLVVQSESQGDAFATGIDPRDGSTRWHNDHQKISSWTSPIAIAGPAPGTSTVLIQSANELSALEPSSGKKLWSYKAACDGIASPCYAGGVVYLPAEGITALHPTPGAAEPDVLWKSNQLQPGAASPFVADGKLYIVNRSGVLVAADPASGEIVGRVRLEGAYWGTPAVSGKQALACSFEGMALAVDLTEAGGSRIAGRLALGEQVQASPAVADGAVFVRSDRHLWKLVAAKR